MQHLELILSLAEAQHGVVSIDQLAFAGSTRHQIRKCKEGTRWEVVTPRVLRLRGAPPTEHTHVMTALLDAGPGGVVSHQTALAMWGVNGFELKPVHVSHPRRTLHRDLTRGQLHTSRTIPPHHVAIIEGIPVCTPARALFDIAPHVHRLRVVRTLDTLGAMRLVTGRSMHRYLLELKGSGRSGIRLMRELILERGLDWVPPESNLESRVHELVRRDGQEALVRQPDIGDDDDFIGRLDLWDPLARVDIEVDSERYHSMPTDRAADARRDERLRALGIDVIRVLEHDVWHEGATVVDRIREARDSGRARHGQPPLSRRRAA